MTQPGQFSVSPPDQFSMSFDNEPRGGVMADFSKLRRAAT
jgi:hypothetical protein